MNYLPLEICFIDLVKVDKSQLSHACRRKILCKRRSQTAHSHNENLCGFQLFLTLDAHLLQKQMTAVTENFLVCKLFSLCIAENAFSRCAACNGRNEHYFVTRFNGCVISL